MIAKILDTLQPDMFQYIIFYFMFCYSKLNYLLIKLKYNFYTNSRQTAKITYSSDPSLTQLIISFRNHYKLISFFCQILFFSSLVKPKYIFHHFRAKIERKPQLPMEEEQDEYIAGEAFVLRGMLSGSRKSIDPVHFLKIYVKKTEKSSCSRTRLHSP